MTGPSDADQLPTDLHAQLSAFVDGELDAARSVEIVDRLVGDPEALAFVRGRQRMREAARRVITGNAGDVSDALRQRVLAAADSTPNADHTDAATPVLSQSPLSADKGPPSLLFRRLVWSAIGAAAGIAIGFGWATSRVGDVAGRSPASRPADDPSIYHSTPGSGVRVNADVIPAAMTSTVTRIHLDCSRVSEALHASGYPVALAPLADLVRADVGTASPWPDLSTIGCHYVGAGPCGASIEGTVHLLYKKDGAKPRATISVFVQANRGQLAISPGTLYLVDRPGAAFPMYAWRTNSVVYFLVADDVELADAARRAIPSAPASGT